MCYTATSYICFVVRWFCSTYYPRDDVSAFKQNSLTVKIVPRMQPKVAILKSKIEKKFWGGCIAASPEPSPGVEGIPLPIPHSPRRLRRLVLAPVCKSWIRHWV